ncbi:hypothetical protein X975_00131, partial [Stegodyphus mimosarum]
MKIIPSTEIREIGKILNAVSLFSVIRKLCRYPNHKRQQDLLLFFYFCF